MERLFNVCKSDQEYLIGILKISDDDEKHLALLMEDQDTFLQLLTDKRVFAYTIEQTDFSEVSAYLYFYICLRKFLTNKGIYDPRIIWYVSQVIAFFSVSDQWKDTSHIWHRPKDHYTSILQKMKRAKEEGNKEQMYRLQVHLGDYSLFLSGLYPEYIYYMSEEKEGVGIDYYDEMALTGYKAAGINEGAPDEHITSIHSSLSKNIPIIREAINDYVYSPFLRSVI
jgi:hypothetical protein